MKMSNLVKLYEEEQCKGNPVTVTAECADLRKQGLTTGASSIILSETSGNWDVSTKTLFGLPKNTLFPGRVYQSPTEMGLQSPIMSLRPSPKIMSKSVMLFEEELLGGNTLTLTASCADLRTQGLTTGASSIIVSETSGKWIAFTKPEFCLPMITLLPGRVYQSPTDMGLQSPIMSLRPSPE